MKKWIKAARPRTLPLATSSVLVATGLASARLETWSVLVFSLAMLTAISLQILSNFANDLGDFLKGTDNVERIGPARSIQSGEISAAEMKKAVIAMSLTSLFFGLALLWTALGEKDMFGQALVLLTIGLACIGAAIKYTMGSGAYGYKGFGDIAVFIFFGIVAVSGTYFLFSTSISLTKESIFPAVMVGAFSTAVLNLNNLRDHVNDAALGKRTMVVIMGYERAKLYHFTLVVVAMICLVYSTFLFSSPISLIALVAIVPCTLHLSKVMRCSNPVALDPELKKVALTCFFIGVVFFASSFF